MRATPGVVLNTASTRTRPRSPWQEEFWTASSYRRNQDIQATRWMRWWWWWWWFWAACMQLIVWCHPSLNFIFCAMEVCHSRCSYWTQPTNHATYIDRNKTLSSSLQQPQHWRRTCWSEESKTSHWLNEMMILCSLQLIMWDQCVFLTRFLEVFDIWHAKTCT